MRLLTTLFRRNRRPLTRRTPLMPELLEDRRVPASLSLHNVSVVEATGHAKPAIFAVTLSTPCHSPVSVHYTTADGSATAAKRDYHPVHGTLTFRPGQTTANIVVPVSVSGAHLDEVFKLELSQPCHATLGCHVGVAHITCNTPSAAESTGPSCTSDPGTETPTAGSNGSTPANTGDQTGTTGSQSSGSTPANQTGTTGSQSSGTTPASGSQTGTTGSQSAGTTPASGTQTGTTGSQSSGTTGATGSQSSGTSQPNSGDQTVATSGHITYRLPSGDIYRIATQPGATPEDLTTELNRLSPGTVDETVNTSANGQWLVISTDRFGMSGWAGLAVVRADLSAGAAIQVNGAFFHGEGLNAVSSNGNLVVYSSDGGPHIRDLWAVTRVNGVWTGPQLLTANSPFAYNAQPCLSADGTRLLFDGGNAPTKTGSQAICEVRVDGSGLRQLVTEANAPAGADTTGRITTAAYAADGSIIFEASWTGDQIWRLAPGAAKAAPASGANNEVAPAVLPDGRIVSLWLDRAGNPNGSHELTVRAADGTYLFTLQPQVDVLDIGLGGGA